MLVRKRGLDSNERADLWRRWRAGQSLSDIARALDKPSGSVFGFVVMNGGSRHGLESGNSARWRCRSARVHNGRFTRLGVQSGVEAAWGHRVGPARAC